MNSRVINQNVENSLSHGNMSISHIIPVQNNQDLIATNDNSNADADDSQNENGLAGNFIQEDLIAYNGENLGNEDEKINTFDISRINSNKSN